LRKASVLVVVILLIAAAQFVLSTPTALGSASTRRFGFVLWQPPGGVGYSPQVFFNAMFLTPPYPSTAWFVASSDGDIQWLSQLGVLAQRYPNIKIMVTILFDANDTAQAIHNDTGWGDVENSMLPMLAQGSGAFYGIGFGFEFADSVSHVTAPVGSSTYAAFWNAQLQRMQTDAAGYGWSEVNYYDIPQGATLPSGAYTIKGIDEPQDPYPLSWVGGLGPTDIAEFGGSDVEFPSPSLGCNSIGGPMWSAVALAQGYQSSVGNSAPCAYSYAATIPWFLGFATAQYVYLSPGYNSNAYHCDPRTTLACVADSPVPFTGVSGIQTIQNWDQPAFRASMAGYVSSNPDVYLTSNGEVPPAGQTTTTTLGGNQTSATSTESSATTSNSSVSTQSTTSISSSATTRAATTVHVTTATTAVSSTASTTSLSSETSTTSAQKSQSSTTTSSSSTVTTPQSHYNFQTSTISTSGPPTTTSASTASVAQSTVRATSTAEASSRQGAYSGSPLETDIPFVPAFLGIGAGALLGFAFLTGLERSGFSWSASLEQRRRQLTELATGPRRTRFLVRTGSSVTGLVSALVKRVSRILSRKDTTEEPQ
jgi:hypothetical protein